MKIIISATTSWNLYNSRFSLAKALKKRGIEVVLLAPHDEYSQRLVDAGFRWVHFPLEPRGKKIIRELRSIIFLIRFYRREKPDLVHHFTPKGVIYGSFAAKLSGIKHIYNTITGLGYVFSDEANRLLRTLVLLLYPLALANTITIFQNLEDKEFFNKLRIVDLERGILIPSSGVDTNRFRFVPEESRKPIILLSSRFVEEKGIKYFVEASRILKDKGTEITFVLIGKPEDDQPTAIQLSDIQKWISDGLVEWWGWYDKMEAIYPQAHIVCLPTYYREGVPKVLIEAAACGRALIATDAPGCREIVLENINGLLVSPKNAIALSQAIETLALNPQLRQQMGKRGREIAVSKFSKDKIIAEYFEIYKI